MVLDDWLISFFILHLAKSDVKYPLQGGDDVCEGEGLWRELHGGLGLDGTLGLGSSKHGGRGHMAWKE